MPIQFYPGINNQCWDEATIIARLDNVAKADKSKQWIQKDLSTPQSGNLEKYFWVVAKHFNYLRRSIYDVDLDVSKNILENLGIMVTPHPEMRDLFYRAVNNFQTITGRFVNVPAVKWSDLVEKPSTPVAPTAPPAPVEVPHPVVRTETVIIREPVLAFPDANEYYGQGPVIITHPVFVPPPDPIVIRRPLFGVPVMGPDFWRHRTPIRPVCRVPNPPAPPLVSRRVVPGTGIPTGAIPMRMDLGRQPVRPFNEGPRVVPGLGHQTCPAPRMPVSQPIHRVVPEAPRQTFHAPVSRPAPVVSSISQPRGNATHVPVGMARTTRR